MKHLKKETIQKYIDDELPIKKREKVIKHISECEFCKHNEIEIRKEIKKIKNIIKENSRQKVPKLMFKFSDMKNSKRKKSYITIPVPLFSLIVALILFMGIFLIFQKNKIDKLSGSKINKREPILSYVELESKNMRKIISIDLDLSDYSIVKKSKITVMRSFKNDKKEM